MRTTISGVKLFAVAYAWSQAGVSYFFSTCGKTSPAAKMYTTHFEDDFGSVQIRHINRPDIVHFLYEYLPLIDEHNKQRQSLLNLEMSWPTRNCWFRLLVTLTGMCVVDLHRVYRNIKLRQTTSAREDAEVDAMEIRNFSDKLCKNIRFRPNRGAANIAQFNLMAQQAAANVGDGVADQLLVRIKAEDGSTARNVTVRQSQKGRSVGT